MTAEFRESFAKDLRAVKDQDLLIHVKMAIEAVEQAPTLGDISGLVPLKGWSLYYRIRVGDYRIGVVVDGDVVRFVRFLHRKDIYRYFP